MTFPTGLHAETIDEVIHSLDEIIIWAKAHNNRLGYFPSLYKKVTVAVKNGIAEGVFEDGKRMEKLDVIFANRYLDAIEAYAVNKPVSASWEISFKAEKWWSPIVLQHLLSGMNAHIDLDLGIAAAEVMKGKHIEDLQPDFYKINEILFSLINEVQDELAEIWPPMKWIDRFAGTLDENLAKFGMKLTRNGAWDFAKRLAETSESNWGTQITKRNTEVADIGTFIVRPKFIASFILFFIRIGEKGTIASRIQILN